MPGPRGERVGGRAAKLDRPVGGHQHARCRVVASRVPNRRQGVVERLRVVDRDRHQLDRSQTVGVFGTECLEGAEDLGAEILERLGRGVAAGHGGARHRSRKGEHKCRAVGEQRSQARQAVGDRREPVSSKRGDRHIDDDRVQPEQRLQCH